MEAQPVEEFLAELEEDNRQYYSRLSPSQKTYWPTILSPEAAVEALKVRWFNEYIGCAVLARLIEKIDHPRLKMLVARQVGDEAKHAMVCEARIQELGGSVADYEPPSEQLRMYEVLDSVVYPEEFFAAMQFTTESEGVKRNEEALLRFDPQTADMFRHAINPDEIFHVNLGWTALRLLCTNAESQDRARRACRRQRDLHREWTEAYAVRMRQQKLLGEASQ